MNTRQLRMAERQYPGREHHSLAPMILLGVIGLAIVLLIGKIGHLDQQAANQEGLSDLQNQMAVACHLHATNCQQLINQVEASGQFEVLSANGYYWTEAK